VCVGQVGGGPLEFAALMIVVAWARKRVT